MATARATGTYGAWGLENSGVIDLYREYNVGFRVYGLGLVGIMGK